jgi:hypothetical protein
MKRLALFDQPTKLAQAGFSPDRLYRYNLMRYWGDPQDGILNMLMLNPSTADEKVNDPTVQLCEEHARAWGYAGLLVTNIFAWRSTDPKALYKLGDPIGVPENDAAVLMCAKGSPARSVRLGSAWKATRARRSGSNDAHRCRRKAALSADVREDRATLASALFGI